MNSTWYHSFCQVWLGPKFLLSTFHFSRNLPLCSMEDFQDFLQNLDFKFFEHGVTGYRTPLGGHVYTASDDPPEVTMEPHNECSYSPFFPKKVCLNSHFLFGSSNIVFMCDTCTHYVLIKVGQCYVFLSKTLHSHRAPLHPRESVDSSKLFRQSEKKIWG